MNDITASSGGYRRVAAEIDEPIDAMKQAGERLRQGLIDIGTPWHEDGVSKDYAEKFPGSMDSLLNALGAAGEGLTKIKGNFRTMAHNIDVNEENNQK